MRAPEAAEVKVFRSAAEFRSWLETHHDSEAEAWIGYYRKGVPKASISYAEAVDEALCFGWIDGIGYRIGDELYANRFTPRRKRSTWSATNIRRVEALLAAGLMRPAGIRAYEARTIDNSGIYSYENRPADLPDGYRERLESNQTAWRWWRAQTPGYRRTATWWVVSAKQESTRDRRLATLIADSAAGRMVKPLTYGRRDIER